MRKITVLFLSIIILISACDSTAPKKSEKKSVAAPRKLSVKVDLQSKTWQVSPSQTVAYVGAISPDSAFLVCYDSAAFAAAVDYSDFRCFMGRGGSLRECKIIQTLRLRDGGTTQIMIEDSGGIYSDMLQVRISEFVFPYVSSGPDKSTFNHRPITRF